MLKWRAGVARLEPLGSCRIREGEQRHAKLDLLVIQIDGLHVGNDLVLVAALGIDGEGKPAPSPCATKSPPRAYRNPRADKALANTNGYGANKVCMVALDDLMTRKQIKDGFEHRSR